MRAMSGIFVGLLLVLPGVATAQQSSSSLGVHVDPGSPAGKEYQIPVAAARNEAAGGSRSGSPSSDAGATAFGTGITAAAGPRSSSAGGTGTATSGSLPGVSAAGRRGTPGMRTSSGTSGKRKRADAAVPAVLAASSSESSAGDTGWIPLVIGGALVLLLGGGGGLALRSRFVQR